MKTKPTETHSSSFGNDEKVVSLVPPKPASSNFLMQTQLGSFNETLDIPSNTANNKRHSAAAMHDIKEEKSELTNSNPNA